MFKTYDSVGLSYRAQETPKAGNTKTKRTNTHTHTHTHIHTHTHTRTTPLLLLNGLNNDKEVIAPLFKIRRSGPQPLETTRFLCKNSVIALPSASLNKEVVTTLSYLSRLAATGTALGQSLSGQFRSYARPRLLGPLQQPAARVVHLPV